MLTENEMFKCYLTKLIRINELNDEELLDLQISIQKNIVDNNYDSNGNLSYLLFTLNMTINEEKKESFINRLFKPENYEKFLNESKEKNVIVPKKFVLYNDELFDIN